MCLGIPGQLVEIVSEEFALGTVEISGLRRPVSLGMLPEPAAVGDWVLVHVGFAVARIDEEQAARTTAWVQEMGEAYAEEMGSFEQSGGPRAEAHQAAAARSGDA